MIRLQHLVSFLALAEELHFGRAAQRLHFAQPTLSEQIRTLEQELGVELVLRLPRKVVLTQAGEVLAAEGRRLVAQLDRAVTSTVRAARGEVGRLAVGATSSAVVGLLPPVIRAFRQRHPDVALEVVESPIVKALDELLAERVDLAFVRTPVPDAAVASEVVLSEPWVAVLPDHHHLADAVTVAPADLAGEVFIFFERFNNPLMYDELVAYCEPAGAGTRDVSDFSTLQALVAAGLGFSLQPGSIAAMTRRDLVLKALHPPGLESELVAVWRPGEPSPVREEFMAVTRELVATGRAPR